MATRFDPLELGDERLFGVRMHGAFGRGDRQRLLDLAARCLQRQKTRLVLECHDLESLGGGGAGVLADLQRQLVAQGGEAVFVGAGEVVQRFLARKFDHLPLRFFDDVPAATAALVAGATGAPAPAPDAGAPARAAGAAGGDPLPAADGPEPPGTPGHAAEGTPDGHAEAADLDRLLGDVSADPAAADAPARRTADLVTAPYISLDDALAAVASGNTTLLAEALGVLLDGHDLAAETIFCLPRQQHYVAADGRWRLPAEGGIVAALTRTGRPLTMLDLEDGDLWDEETELLEQLQPDIILPLIRQETLTAVLLLQHAVTGHDYTLSEMFALELLQRVLADAGADRAGEATAKAAPPPAERPERDDALASRAAPVAVPPLATSSSETLLNVKLELARGLQQAQDVPHFWQVFISRLRLGAEVSSLVFLDGDPAGEPFLAGEARRGLGEADLASERIRTFFRTLERPVEIENMPVSFRTERDALLGRGLQWLIGLRADDHDHLGVVALGLRWRCHADEPADEIQGLMEITAEALMRLRENQRRADMSVGLLENLLAGGPEQEPGDPVTASTVAAVRLLAAELGLPADQLRDLVLGALLRNLGQQQPAPSDLEADQLTGAQWEVFRSHPGAGDQALAALNAPAAVRDAIRHHHERFDGRGFPAGLKGRDIPLAARLVAVAQFYALHRHQGDTDGALEAVTTEAGQALDPDLVQMFLKAHRRVAREPVTA